MPAATIEAPVEFVPTMVINIRYPEERVAFTEETTFKNKPVREITGEYAQFSNTQYVAKTQEELDQLLRVCPYLFVEPTEGELFTDERYGFATRSIDAYKAWMNSEWRNAREEAV